MNNKRIIIRAAAVMLLLCMAVSLTACVRKLNGTYASKGLIRQTLTFDGNNVTLSAFGINASGKYRIEGDSIIFTYSLFGSEQSLTKSFKKEGNTIIIGGTAFDKV